MRYLCLVYLDETVLAGLSLADRAVLEAECRDYRECLQRSGRLIVGEALHSALSTTTLRIQGDHVSLHDGPVAEGREQPAAIYLFEAYDLNDAIVLASRIPPVRLGCAEVRALHPRAPP
ncbi:dehydrogenase [Stutzerimonas stutzeri]|uniref:Dehydrogenase n=1 Tax=Stutzerimonas stutzeri TaxID=316 RepID=W8RNY2_STUST|nr:YciI family protein [Stutzerimonas stutzeri]AHL73721.1 dehydrogenase [Stutzerimonas stutzeri]MCQ4328764.1 YciI family protein [Stutzerimonas stutzeri]